MKAKPKKILAVVTQLILELILALIIVYSSLYVLNIKPHHMEFNFRVGVILTVITVIIIKLGRGVHRLNQYNKGRTNKRGTRYKQHKILRSMRQLNRYLGLGLLYFMLVGFTRANVVDLVTTTSGSMKPTVEKGEYVLINKVADVQRFDVIMFQSPDKRYQHFLKRIVGLPGDTVEFEGDKLILNGRRITEEYLVRPDTIIEGDYYTKNFKVSKIHGSNLVPDGMVFVMGDSRRGSRDSRIIGFVPIDSIVGRAVAVRGPDDPWYDLASWDILEDVDIYGSKATTKSQYEANKNKLIDEINKQESGTTDAVHGKQE